MTKKEAISIISRCAKLYNENLCDKQLAFVYRDANNKPHVIEILFRANNFMHFTGIDTIQHQTAGAFYRDALDHKIKESCIIFKNPYTTELKLNVLQKIMNIAYNARMIGDYTGSRIELYTDKVTGTTSACLGIIKSDHDYIPNTVLSEDIRNVVSHPPGKIFAIFRKAIKEPLYSELTYHSKNMEITRKCLPPAFADQINPDAFSDKS